MIVARILFAFLSAFSYPLQTLPCRLSIESLIPVSKSYKRQNGETLRKILIVAIIVASFAFAFFLDDLALISGLIGTLAGIPICYILPFAFYMKLTVGRGWTKKRIAATALAIFGVIAMIISGISLIINIIHRYD